MMKTKIFICTLAVCFALASPAAAETLVSKPVKGPLPADPADKAWGKANPVDIHMEPQRSIRPGISEPSTPSVRVSSLHNGSEIAFRLEWRDATKNDAANMSDMFSDACAIQFPLLQGDAAPSYMMGDDEKLVHIIHWKAAWERDITEGYQDVEHAYPNYNIDGYPLMKTAEGKARYPIKDFTKEATAYMAGISAGNPVSDTQRKVPAEELNAQGFRTITTQAQNDAWAKGTWNSGSWSVVIKRKLDSGDGADSLLKKGKPGLMAVAVWDGGSRNAGGRKSYSGDGWITLKVE